MYEYKLKEFERHRNASYSYLLCDAASVAQLVLDVIEPFDEVSRQQMIILLVDMRWAFLAKC